MDNKLGFAERLRDAMVAAGLEPRPGVLLSLFNSKYWGRSVTFQAVSRWLKGEAIPAQDKLLVLSELLKIEPEVLRFGASVRHAVQEHRDRWQAGVGYLERETFDAFLQLPPPQRKLVREIILTFAKVYPAERPAAATPPVASVPLTPITPPAPVAAPVTSAASATPSAAKPAATTQAVGRSKAASPAAAPLPSTSPSPSAARAPKSQKAPKKLSARKPK